MADLEPPAAADLLARARALYDERRRRARFVDPALLGEPAWDLLLDLYVATGQRRRIGVSSACIAAGVPATTALRWIARLVDAGYLLRRSDAQDARRTYLSLTREATMRMEAYLATLPATVAP